MRNVFASLFALSLTHSLLAPAVARAETLTCTYTEPFVNTVYQTGGRRLTLRRGRRAC